MFRGFAGLSHWISGVYVLDVFVVFRASPCLEYYRALRLNSCLFPQIKGGILGAVTKVLFGRLLNPVYRSK